MAKKEANTDIRCTVENCAYHCGEQNYCSLRSIHVESLDSDASSAKDASMCGSFKQW